MLMTFDYQEILHRWGLSGWSREALVIVAAAFALALVLVLWAVFFRKKPRHHHEHRYGHKPHSESRPSERVNQDESSGGSRGSRRWRRRRRRSHRPRNPTLAETGGLPPVRPDRASESWS